MPIIVYCQQCGKKNHAPDSAAAKQGALRRLQRSHADSAHQSRIARQCCTEAQTYCVSPVSPAPVVPKVESPRRCGASSAQTRNSPPRGIFRERSRCSSLLPRKFYEEACPHRRIFHCARDVGILVIAGLAGAYVAMNFIAQGAPRREANANSTKDTLAPTVLEPEPKATPVPIPLDPPPPEIKSEPQESKPTPPAPSEPPTEKKIGSESDCAARAVRRSARSGRSNQSPRRTKRSLILPLSRAHRSSTRPDCSSIRRRTERFQFVSTFSNPTTAVLQTALLSPWARSENDASRGTKFCW